MAAVVGAVVARATVRKFIGPQAIRAFLARGDVRGVLAIVGLSELIDFIQGEQDQSLVSRLPRYAIVDLRTQDIIKTLSARRVYIMLTRPRTRRSGSKTVIKEVCVLPHHDGHH